MNMIDLRNEYIAQLRMKESEFSQFLSCLIGVARELDKEYNNLYQQLFNIKFYSLLTEGSDYVDQAICSIDINDSPYLLSWYRCLQHGLSELKDLFTEDEFYYLEYRRNNVCHIFQDSYDHIQNNGEIRGTRTVRNKSGERIKIDIKVLIERLKGIILQYGDGNPRIGDESFDRVKIKLIYPMLEKLSNDLNEIHVQNMLQKLEEMQVFVKGS